MSTLFRLPKVVPIDSSGTPYASAKLEFFLTGTSTNTDTYSDSALATPHANPVVADANGVFAPIFLDPEITYKATLSQSDDTLIYTVDPVSEHLTQANIGLILYPRTTAETSAGVTPTNYQYEPGVINRYGTNTTPGTTNMTTAINAALSCAQEVIFLDEDYAASALTGSQDNQTILSKGTARIIKNANGDLFTHSGDQLEINGIQFRGDASTPTFTGHNIVLSGENPRLINCGSRWAYARALKSTGSGLQIVGTSDIYQSALQDSGTDYDIEIGVSGTATLYHRITGITTSQATGGIHLIDTGSHVIAACQFGKLFVDAGTSPAGVNGGITDGSRILGDITIDMANAVIIGNQIGEVDVVFAAGVSGHVFLNNTMVAGATITNNGGESLIVRDVSSGSGTALRFGDDTSTAVLTIDPTSPGRFNFTAIGLPNNVFQTFRNAADSAAAGQIGVTSGDAFQLLASGNLQIGGANGVGIQCDGDSTAGNTRMFVYDVDNGQLERVSVGAADSGGSGFKVLRIPN